LGLKELSRKFPLLFGRESFVKFFAGFFINKMALRRTVLSGDALQNWFRKERSQSPRCCYTNSNAPKMMSGSACKESIAPMLFFPNRQWNRIDRGIKNW